MRKLRRALSGAVMLLALVLFAVPAAAEDDVIFEVTDERVQKASGLAADRDRQMYWTVNSGPDSDRAMALRSDGSVEGTVRFGRTMEDPQGVYYIGSRLYIADIGDKDGTRDSIAVYRYANPQPVGRQPEDVRTFEMSYSDGERRDARAMLVGDDGQLFVITHAAKGEVWATNGPPRSGINNELTKVGDAPAWVTDAVFLDDGRIATRSYTSIEILDSGTYQVAARAPAPWQQQGEALALSLDRQSLILGSSGQKQPVVRVAIPDDLKEAPAPGPTPPASPKPDPKPQTPEPTENAEDAPPADDRDGGERTGTMVAVLAAGVLALASAGVVYFIGAGRRAPAAAGPAEEPIEPAEPEPIEPVHESPFPEPAPAAAESPFPEPEPASPFVAQEPAEPARPLIADPAQVEQARPLFADPEPDYTPPPVEQLDLPSQPAAESPFREPTAAPDPLLPDPSAPGPAMPGPPMPAAPMPRAPMPSAPMPAAPVPGPPASDAPVGPPPTHTPPATAVPPAAVPPTQVPPATAVPPAAMEPEPVPRRAILPEDDAPLPTAEPRRSFTISEGEPDVPVRPRPRRASVVEPDHAIDSEGTWVRPRRSAEEQAADLKWLNRGR
ncbi:hypothetical protein [Enemella sp. A6]|uniref:hypothetical protein n=1 Tax=Enemella sp. A6 TaxID=3440152 RepID=UPI003EB6BA9E